MNRSNQITLRWKIEDDVSKRGSSGVPKTLLIPNLWSHHRKDGRLFFRASGRASWPIIFVLLLGLTKIQKKKNKGKKAIDEYLIWLIDGYWTIHHNKGIHIGAKRFLFLFHSNLIKWEVSCDVMVLGKESARQAGRPANIYPRRIESNGKGRKGKKRVVDSADLLSFLFSFFPFSSLERE